MVEAEEDWRSVAFFFLPAPILKVFFVHAHEQSFEPKTKRVKALVSTLSRGFPRRLGSGFSEPDSCEEKGHGLLGLGQIRLLRPFHFQNFLVIASSKLRLPSVGRLCAQDRPKGAEKIRGIDKLGNER